MPCRSNNTGRSENKSNDLRLQPVATPLEPRMATCDQVSKFTALQTAINKCANKCKKLLEGDCSVSEIIKVTFEAGVLHERAAAYAVLAQYAAKHTDISYSCQNYRSIEADLAKLGRAQKEVCTALQELRGLLESISS